MIPYDSLLNRTASAIPPSGIRRFFDIAAEMEDVISLSVGEPDFQTPWHVRDVAIDSLQKGRTGYSPNRGFTALCREISGYYRRRFGLDYDDRTEILVTVGGSEATAFRSPTEQPWGRSWTCSAAFAPSPTRC